MTKRKSRVSRSHGDSLVYYLLHSKTPHIIQEWSGMTTMNGAQRAPAAAAVGVCAKNGICGRRELWQESSEHMQPYKYRKCTLCSPITGALDSEENFTECSLCISPKNRHGPKDAVLARQWRHNAWPENEVPSSGQPVYELREAESEQQLGIFNFYSKGFFGILYQNRCKRAFEAPDDKLRG